MPSIVEPTSISFNPLHPTFGAEVVGVDWSQPMSKSTLQELRSACEKYGVIVFRKACLDNTTQIEFSRQLGELDDIKVHMKAGRVGRFPDQPEIFDVSNLDHEGKIVTNADPGRREASKGNLLWHADMAFNPRRASYSLLNAVELPPKGTGGETLYSDSRTAYDDLDQELKDELEDLVCNNSLYHNRKLAAPEFFKSVEPTDYPMARHKLVQMHEASRRKNLYVTTYAHHFDGQTKEESQPLVEKLLKHIEQEKYVLPIYYENDGDLVMWDNTAVLHRATAGGTYDAKYKRDMRRTTVKDGGGNAWGENEPGTAWQAGLPLSFSK